MTATTFNIHSLKRKIKIEKSSLHLYFLCVVFLIGLIVGCFSVKNNDLGYVNSISDFYIQYARTKCSLKTSVIFLNTFVFSSFVLIINYFIGLCAVGIPISAIIPFFFGSFIGIISGYIYETYMLKGLGYCAIIIFPAAVIISCAVILSSRESFLMSKTMMNLLLQKPRGGQQSFKEYSVKYLVYLALTAAGAAVEATATKLFIALFSF